MEARDLLRAQFTWVHQLLEGTMSDCSEETAHHRGEGWAINPIAAIHAHISMTQDGIVHGLVQGKPTLLQTNGWAEKLGVDAANPTQNPDWAEQRFDLDLLREYAAAVQAATDAFLAEAPDDVLLRAMETPMGELRAIEMLANVGIAHVASHWGEIAALRGVQGEKGLPF